MNQRTQDEAREYLRLPGSVRRRRCTASSRRCSVATESRGIHGTLVERKRKTAGKKVMSPELRQLEAAFMRDIGGMSQQDHYHEPKLDIIRLGDAGP